MLLRQPHRAWAIAAVALGVLVAALLGVAAYKIIIGAGAFAVAATYDRKRRDRATREATQFRTAADRQFYEDDADRARVAERVSRARETVRDTPATEGEDPLLNQGWLDKDRG